MEEKKEPTAPATEKEEKKDAGAQGACGCTWSYCGKLVACS